MKSKVVEEADVLTYVVVCDPGDEALAALAQSAHSGQLEAAQIIAIGAFDRATGGWGDRATREYRRIPVDQQCELLSFVGDVAVGEDGPVAHMHGVLVADLTLLAVLATAAGLLGAPLLSAPVFVMSCPVAIAVFEPFGGLAHPVVAVERERAAANRLSELFPATPERTTMHDPGPGARGRSRSALRGGRPRSPHKPHRSNRPRSPRRAHHARYPAVVGELKVLTNRSVEHMRVLSVALHDRQSRGVPWPADGRIKLS